MPTRIVAVSSRPPYFRLIALVGVVTLFFNIPAGCFLTGDLEIEDGDEVGLISLIRTHPGGVFMSSAAILRKPVGIDRDVE